MISKWYLFSALIEIQLNMLKIVDAMTICIYCTFSTHQSLEQSKEEAQTELQEAQWSQFALQILNYNDRLI